MEGSRLTPGPPIGPFRSSREGLAKVLGPLEATMMEAVWASNGPVTARDVEEVSGTEAKYITVLTVLNNLTKKGLLHRERRGRVMVFEAMMSREALLSSVSLDVIRGLIDLSPRVAVNSFVGTLEELDPETLEELRRELAIRLGRRDEENDS